MASSSSATRPTGRASIRLSVFGWDRTGNPYPPHPTQTAVREWAVERIRTPQGGIPVLYLQHGVRSGGTRAILNVLLARLFTEPGLRALDCRHEFADLRSSVMETVFEIVPSVLIAEKNEQEHRYVLRGKAGPSTLFFSGLKDVAGKGSTEFGCIAVHEAQEITLRDYRMIKNRCNQAHHPPMLLMEGNAPSEGHWLTRVQNPKDREYDPDLTVMVLSSEENKAALDPAYWDSLNSMPAEWRRRYLLGVTGALPSGNPVYPAFTETVHVRETAIIPDRPILRFWDFGYRRAAVAWAQRTDDGQLLVHREWIAIETPEDTFISLVQQRTNLSFGSLVASDYGDPAATQRDPQGISTLRRLQEHGIILKYRQTTYADRIPLVNRKLSEMIRGEPAILIHPRCTVLIEALAGGYAYPELSEGMELTAKREVPRRDSWFEHIANALEYGIVNLYMGMPDAQREQRREVVRHRRERLQRRHGVVSF